MKTRVAKKILKPDLLHFYCYGSGLWSLAPRNPQRYFKAHKVLHKKPYYSRERLTLIYTVFGKPKNKRCPIHNPLIWDHIRRYLQQKG